MRACEYELTGNRRFFWFPKDFVENDRISFRALDGSQHVESNSRLQVVKAKDGQVRLRNWHFGIEGIRTSAWSAT